MEIQTLRKRVARNLPHLIKQYSIPYHGRFDRLSELDPDFAWLRSRHPKSKLTACLTLLKDGSMCAVCQDRLAWNIVCRLCFKTEEGKALSNEGRLKKFEQTCLKRYGVLSPMSRVETLNKRKATWNKNYGTDHPMRSAKVKTRFADSCLERYGVDHPMKSASVLSKQTDTNIGRYGVPNQFQRSEVKTQTRIASLTKYGLSHHAKSLSVRRKIKATLIDRLGVDHPFKSSEVMSKVYNTMRQRYGVDRPVQNAGIFRKYQLSCFDRKSVDILGQAHVVQGYEPQVLQHLESNGHIQWVVTEADQMPEIWYTDDSGKRRRYYPDFVFESAITGNLYICEVKSLHTLKLKNVLSKASAAIDFCKQSHGMFYYALAVCDRKSRIKWIRSTEDFYHVLKSRE